jgi:phosphohistidine phosphatase SixA
VSVLLVRHAKAGDREKWDAPDDLRPLTAKGEAQAEALVDLLAGYDIDRVLSSPYLRCTQTVAPLASARGLAVEPCDDLAEGEGRAGIALTRGLLEEPAFTVLCSHGDVVEEVLDALGVRREQFTRKGATWVLDESGARHLPAPPT